MIMGLTDYFSFWYVAGLAITGYISYYLHEIVRQPILACGPGKYRDFLASNVPILQEKFWPTLWCWESRMQTVLGHYIRQLVIPNQPYRREILKLPDGGDCALDWREADSLAHDAPILVALPGLTGSSDVEYMLNIALTMNRAGIRCVVFNNRGLGGLQLKTPKAYCATYVDDLLEVLIHVRSVHPKSPMAVLGVSMGGLIVGNFISCKAEEARNLLAAAVLISPPWNVLVGTTNIEKPFINCFLNRQLAMNLVETFSRYTETLFDPITQKKRCRNLFENVLDCNAVVKSRSVREFDTNFTSKAFGYKDLLDYYTHASIHEKIPKFAVPTLCLSAADDPFQPIHGIPLEEANKSPNVAIVVPAHGGHIGFMEGLFPFSTNQYMQRIVSQYLSSILNSKNYEQFKTS